MVLIMQKYSRLNRVPLGGIRAKGFLKEQLIRGKHGMAGHLYELEPGIIADPYVRKSKVSAWTDVNQSGWAGEISANYWNGYIQHAFILNDVEMMERATKWVDDMMKNQKKDGYCRPFLIDTWRGRGRWRKGGWPYRESPQLGRGSGRMCRPW